MEVKYLLVFSFLLCGSVIVGFPQNTKNGDPDWWKHAVFYQIYPRSFKDNNNDGIGDLQGIISKLPHLKDIGVTAAWLSPIYKSPQVDAGYDISDFMDIDEDYGTLQDFDDLVQKAHELGIKIVMDFVPNHSSNEHEWFKKSEMKDAEFDDYYIWKDGKSDGSPPNNWISRFKYSAWEFSETRNQYYLHQFAIQQPDLNYRNPLVVQHMKDVLKFWLDKGVDGFRMDAVPFLYEDAKFQDEPLSGIPSIGPDEYEYLQHIHTNDLNETFDMIYEWREFLDSYTEENGVDARIMMTEAYTDIENTMKYYGNGDKLGAHFTFNFMFIINLNKESTARDIVKVVEEWLSHMPSQYVANWVLGNHDNNRVATRFGPERVDGMNMLVALLPGVMVTYNGEEIGQENGEVTWEEGQDPSACNGNKEDFDKISRDFARTPYQWDNTINAGFNEGEKPWLPVSEKYVNNNLAAQKLAGSGTHYHVYQNLLKLRQEDAFVNGKLTIVALSDNVLAFTRESDPDSYVFVMNIANKEEKIDLSNFEVLKKYIKVVATNGNSKKQNRVLSTNDIVLAPYESIVGRALKDVEQGDQDWWKHGVFYQIYPRSFKDGNNDGIGDLKGIISKLEHLKDAGITAAWLSPIYKSPQVDAGYDISDFKDIDEDYGTLEDFDNLIVKAHALGLKIIMDFVPNHSSDQHEWFGKSEKREEGYEDYYIWMDGKTNGEPPNNWISVFKYSAWEYSKVRKQYYLHHFTVQQPDLNFRNPALVKEMEDTMKFWLDRGVDGFRMDAVPWLLEEENFKDEPLSNVPNVGPDEHGYLNHIYTYDQDETYDLIYQWREFLEDYVKEHGGHARIMMTEAYTDLEHTMKYYGDGDRNGAHFSFNFQFITRLNKQSNAENIVEAIEEWLTYMPSKYVANWVLGNHDNHRVATRFGPEKADGLNMLIALLPGIMVTYNGEEIGQENGEVTWEQGQDPGACNGKEEDFDNASRDFQRTPFHWDNSTNAGFNEGATPWLPVSQKYLETNLKAQNDADILSHYQIYKKLIKLRSQPTLTYGKLDIKTVSKNTLGYVRSLPGNDTYVFVFNIGDKSETVNLKTVFPELSSHLRVVLSSDTSREQGSHLAVEELTVGAYEGLISISEELEQTTTECPTTTEGSTTTESYSSKTTAAFTSLFACFILILVAQ